MQADSDLEVTHIEVEVDGVPRRFPLTEGTSWTIGRDTRNAIVLPGDMMASRKHAMVQRDTTGQHYLSDLGSRNGTTVNGLPVTTPVRLHDGDAFAIGAHQFLFHHPLTAAGDPTSLPQAATAHQVVRRMMTVLVVDLRNFTVMSRALGEARLSELMGEFFGSAGEMLKANGSWTQKYIGDAVMAAWVHDAEEDTPREMVLMLESLSSLVALVAELNERYALTQPIEFGAGVNSGFAVTGNMGSSARSDHTAMGDTVNKAFRLESASKEIGCNIVIGRDSFELMAMPEPARALFAPHTVLLKGYDDADDMYSLSFADLPALLHLLGGADVG